nr:efflux RND transporter permease subunit [Sphingobacterium sp. E70]
MPFTVYYHKEALSQSIETSMQASRIIKEFEEVKMVVGKTGAAEVPTDPMPPEATDLMVVLKPQKEWKSGRSYNELGAAILEKLEVIPGVFFEKNQPIQMRFNELMTGIRQDVAVKIFGENIDSLASYANIVAAQIQSVKGATSRRWSEYRGCHRSILYMIVHALPITVLRFKMSMML